MHFFLRIHRRYMGDVFETTCEDYHEGETELQVEIEKKLLLLSVVN